MAKGALTDEARAAMKAATAEMAATLVDDLGHIRTIVSAVEPTPGDIRRLAVLVRRLLIYDELRKVATPRTGRIQIRAPDLNPLYRSNEKRPFLFLLADQVTIFGVMMAAMMVEQGAGARELPNFHPDAKALLRLDTFQNQRVLCHKGTWVTRADAITYVANVGGNVHTTDAAEVGHLLIREVRNSARISLQGEGVQLGYRLPSTTEEGPIRADPTAIDVALLMLVGTAQHLTSSPDVMALEAAISASG